MRFLDSDTYRPGLKNGEFTSYIAIGSQDWITNGAAFSDDFIKDLINKTRMLKNLKIYSAKTIQEIKETILTCWNKTGILTIVGTDGRERIKTKRLRK